MKTKLYIPNRADSDDYPIVDLDVAVVTFDGEEYIQTIDLHAAAGPVLSEQMELRPSMLVESHYVKLERCGKVGGQPLYKITTPEEERIQSIRKHGYQSELRSGPMPKSQCTVCEEEEDLSVGLNLRLDELGVCEECQPSI